MMRALRWLTLVVVFLAAGLGYLLLATAANWIVVRLVGYQLLWLDAPFLWNALVFGGFVVSGGVAASCVAALTARRALDVPKYLRVSLVAAVCVVVLAATYQDLARLTGSRYAGSKTWGFPGWLILVYGAITAGICAFGWLLWSGLRQPRRV
jgi:hypothetical protein